MRAFTTVFFSLTAALVAAQGTNSTVGPNAFNIPEGQSSYVVTAGRTVDLSWSNQQGSTVTIKLQVPGYTTESSGITLAQSIPNTGSTTVTIPAGANIPAGAYTFEIINTENTSEINFAPPFSIASASGTGSFGATAMSTGSASASASSASASATTTGSVSTTRSSASVSSTSASASASQSSSAASTSQTAASTTSAPNSNAGAKVGAPLAAAMLLGAAAFL